MGGVTQQRHAAFAPVRHRLAIAKHRHTPALDLGEQRLHGVATGHKMRAQFLGIAACTQISTLRSLRKTAMRLKSSPPRSACGEKVVGLARKLVGRQILDVSPGRVTTRRWFGTWFEPNFPPF
jgi:hypothetical protein